jgi:hypothetical protein
MSKSSGGKEKAIQVCSYPLPSPSPSIAFLVLLLSSIMHGAVDKFHFACFPRLSGIMCTWNVYLKLLVMPCPVGFGR